MRSMVWYHRIITYYRSSHSNQQAPNEDITNY